MKNKNLIVINYYQCIDHKNINHATEKTVYAQQYLSLCSTHAHPDPIKIGHQNLAQFIQDHTTKEDYLILAGDFNTTLGEQTTGIHSIITENQLIDPQAHLHGLDNEVAIYASGSKRLDYIMVSSNMITSITESGYEPFNFRIHSDHTGCFIDIVTDRIIGSTQPIAPPTGRDICATSTHSNTQYINHYTNT